MPPITARTQDGTTFSGQSPADVVRAMRDDNWQRSIPKGEYMDDVIDRVQQITGVDYVAIHPITRETRVASFLVFLHRAGLIVLDDYWHAVLVSAVESAN